MMSRPIGNLKISPSLLEQHGKYCNNPTMVSRQCIQFIPIIYIYCKLQLNNDTSVCVCVLIRDQTRHTYWPKVLVGRFCLPRAGLPASIRVWARVYYAGT